MRMKLAFAACAAAMLLLPTGALAQAEPVTENVTIPFTLEGSSICGGEPFVFEGEQHFVVHTTTDDSGGQHSVFHTNYQNVRAVGASGTVYRMTDNNNGSFNSSGPLPGPEDPPGEVPVRWEQTQTLVGRIVGGGAPTETRTMFTAVFHVTFNANGEVTSIVSHVDIRCETGSGSPPG